MDAALQQGRARLAKKGPPPEPPSLIKPASPASASKAPLLAKPLPPLAWSPSSRSWCPCPCSCPSPGPTPPTASTTTTPTTAAASDGGPPQNIGTALPSSATAASSPPTTTAETSTSTTNVGSQLVGTFSVMTLNVWISMDEVELRMKALGELIASLSVDIVLLQEMTPYLWNALLAQPAIQQHYACTSLVGQTSSYRTCILSKTTTAFPKSMECVDLPGTGRKAVIGQWDSPIGIIGMASVHLQSEANAIQARDLQFTHVASLLSHCSASIIAGDFNINYNKKEQYAQKCGYEDVWAQLHPDERGYTFDGTTNTNVLSSCQGSAIVSRFDRVVVRGRISPVKIDIVAKMPVDGLAMKWISDHYGLLASFVQKV
ncbi:endonuclease/exonuclease/phosphatase family protein [Pelomyxa schiedti]|nr:endonuclease/exonuclease/phosphatase family protein [Pelomyxa schiedti]